jgi:hypothetical protein
MKIKIDWKQYIRDRIWFGFSFIVCEFTDTREWGYLGRWGGGPKPWKFWVIARLNRWV